MEVSEAGHGLAPGSPSWPGSSDAALPQVSLMNAIVRLMRKLRGYFRDVQRSREDLTDSTSQESVLPPIPPGNGKRLKPDGRSSGRPGA
jgi:hypothetical protein